ncbi:Proteophosphoglycan ppg4 [Mycena venus]|uniref:Proteophosphoglycan ppg4 n=1 Tax=Mycena venus TaxID=2733690 RepID=A0A8H7CPE8_9AGAR|nr:Proteophosphoglycan ppg4 [Mycena venus]
MLLPVQPRNLGSDSSSPTNFAPSTWIPIAVVVSVLTLLAVLACTRKSLRSRIASMGNGVAAASGAPVTRELTAEQLAGSINRAPGAPARRPRRPRRTPSQISTVSLPAYMKEPGEQELVVSRGPDGEDVAMPAALAVEEDDDQSNAGHQSSEGHEQTERNVNLSNDDERYTPMPQSPHDTPLLSADPRGDAPAYFENQKTQLPSVVRASFLFSAPPHLLYRSPLPLRRTTTTPPDSPSRTPARDRRPLRRPLPYRHRPSTSTSTLFSLGRKKSSNSLSANNLTSPSLISLASISHPLPHTLVKTEFSALPKSGLTAEQLSLISGNKEGGLGRFGVPWGEAAVAYANASASTSRIALGENGEAPPPGWEEVSGLPSGSRSREAEASGSASASTEPVAPGSGSSEPEAEASGAREEETPTTELAPAALSRADSRASGVSTQTFATAEEGDSEDQHDDDPEVQLRVHVQEPTDATVRP